MSTLAPLPDGRFRFAAAVAAGTVYVFGGQADLTADADNKAYHPPMGTIMKLAPAPVVAAAAAAAAPAAEGYGTVAVLLGVVCGCLVALLLVLKREAAKTREVNEEIASLA